MPFNPPYPNLVLASPVGAFLITVEVQMSDESTFAGTCTVGPDTSGDTFAGMSGNDLVTTVSPIMNTEAHSSSQ
jgi:hypothetical protein